MLIKCRLPHVLGLLVAVSAMLAVGCETIQPTQLDSQVLELRLSAGGLPPGSVDAVQIRRHWQLDTATGGPADIDGDGEPDIFIQCFNTTATPPLASSAPISFSIQVKAIPAGSASPTPLTSPDAADLNRTLNVTQYADISNFNETPAGIVDVYEFNGGMSSGVEPHRVPPPTQAELDQRGITKYIVNQQTIRTVPVSAYEVMSGTESLISDLPPPIGPVFGFRCADEPPPPPATARIDGVETFLVSLGKGDTVVVEARRGESYLGYLGDPTDSRFILPTSGALSGELLLDGRRVAVVGSPGADEGPGGAINFSFTSR